MMCTSCSELRMSEILMILEYEYILILIIRVIIRFRWLSGAIHRIIKTELYRYLVLLG